MIEPSHIAGRIFETIKERLHCVAMYRISKQFERYAEAPSDLFLAAIHPTPDKRIRFDI